MKKRESLFLNKKKLGIFMVVKDNFVQKINFRPNPPTIGGNQKLREFQNKKKSREEEFLSPLLPP